MLSGASSLQRATIARVSGIKMIRVCPQTKNLLVENPWIYISREFPMDLGIPPLKIKNSFASKT